MFADNIKRESSFLCLCISTNPSVLKGNLFSKSTQSCLYWQPLILFCKFENKEKQILVNWAFDIWQSYCSVTQCSMKKGWQKEPGNSGGDGTCSLGDFWGLRASYGSSTNSTAFLASFVTKGAHLGHTAH